MSNDPEQHGEFANLEPLAELPPLVPMDNPEAGAPKGARPTSGPSPANLAARAQEKAPQLLKKAARVLVIGSLLPWIGAELTTNGHLINVALKLGLVAACWMIMKGVDAFYAGSAATGFGSKSLIPGQKGMVGALNGLHIVGALLIVAMIALQFVLIDKPLVIGESVTLLLGGLTFAHIDSYEKGGKFSPLFPLMFAGCAFGGVFGLFGRLKDGNYLAALGCAIVTTAGIQAVHTIAVAMMQAKKDGDIKKAAALEARKQARVTGRGPAR